MSQNHVTPECEPQMVPGTGDDPIALLEAQITARDERIANLVAMVEDGTVVINTNATCLALANSTIAQINTELRSARTRIAELEAALL